jgi:hypothetical protein
MGIREKLNQNPRIAAGATAGVIVIALGFILYESFGGGGPSPPTKAYFTTDDGATYFKDDINKLPPFDVDGKPAVRAMVFKCPEGEPFVAYLERYTPEAKAKLEDLRVNGPPKTPDPGMMDVTMGGMEVKKPKDEKAKWIKQMDYQKAAEIMQPKCPDGTNQNIEPVLP